MTEPEAHAALEAKEANADCPACGRNVWGILQPGEAVLRLRTTWDKKITVVPVVCGHCGFLKMHWIDALTGTPPDEWVRNPPAPV